MKKLWNNAKFKVVVTIAILGTAVTAYLVKQSGKKPETGVVVNGDTLLQTGGDSIKADTATLKP